MKNKTYLLTFTFDGEEDYFCVPREMDIQDALEFEHTEYDEISDVTEDWTEVPNRDGSYDCFATWHGMRQVKCSEGEAMNELLLEAEEKGEHLLCKEEFIPDSYDEYIDSLYR